VVNPDGYPFYDGMIKSSETGTYKNRDYKQKVAERVVDHSSAKHAFGPVKAIHGRSPLKIQHELQAAQAEG